jgi:hypothetical protein
MLTIKERYISTSDSSLIHLAIGYQSKPLGSRGKKLGIV